MKKNYTIEFEWMIERKDRPGFRTGTTTFKTTAKNKIEVMNLAIEFAKSIPSWEFERNDIDIERYLDGCRIMYTTQITKVLSIKVNA